MEKVIKTSIMLMIALGLFCGGYIDQCYKWNYFLKYGRFMLKTDVAYFYMSSFLFLFSIVPVFISTIAVLGGTAFIDEKK